MTGIVAGDTDAVHEQTLATLHRQQLVEVDGQSDIMVVGLPYICPYNVNSDQNPILVHRLGLGVSVQPVPEQAGRPARRRFPSCSTPCRTSSTRCTTRPTWTSSRRSSPRPPILQRIESKYEERYATDPWYIHLYRKSYAYHGVHPFYMWYWERTRSTTWATRKIVVGGGPEDVRAVGYRAASSFRDALEMAGETVGRSPSISYFHVPPLSIADVR